MPNLNYRSAMSRLRRLCRRRHDRNESAEAGQVAPPLPARRRPDARSRALFVLAAGLGIAAGISFYERWLPDLLRENAHGALSKLLGSEVHIERLRPTLAGGLAIRAEGVTAWPGETGPALRIDEVIATLDLRALLRREVRAVRVQTRGAHLDVVRDAEGRWSPQPFARLAARATQQEGLAPPSDFVPPAGIASGVPPVAWRGDLTLAFEDTSVRWIDRTRRGGEPTTLEVRISAGRVVMQEGLREVVLDTRISRDDREIGALDARWTPLDVATAQQERPADADNAGAPATELRSARSMAATAGDIGELVLAAHELEIAGLASLPISGLPPLLSGQVTGIVDITLHDLSDLASRGLVDFDLVASDLRVPLSVGATASRDPLVFGDDTRLRGALVFDSRHAALDLDLRGPQEHLTLSGSLERPANANAELWLAAWLDRSDIGRVRDIAQALPARSRKTTLDALAGVRSARLETVEASAAGPLARWDALLDGEPGAWLRGFRAPPTVAFRLGDVALMRGHTRVDRGGGWIDWRGDAVALRDLTATIDGHTQPVLDLDLEGLASLLAAAKNQPPIEHIGPLPGIDAIADLLEDEPGTENDPPSWRELRIDIDRLAHELLLWPVTDARVEVRPRDDRGAHVALHRARWGGADLVASGDFLPGSPDHVIAHAQVRPSKEPAPRQARTEDWGIARFEIDFSASAELPIARAAGLARARDRTLRLFETTVTLRPSGSVAGVVSFDLSREGAVPFDASGRSEALSTSTLAGLFGGHGPAFTGDVDSADARLVGQLAPGAHWLAGASGDARVVARDGEVRTELPLLLYLASASGGLNPFASTDRVRYSKMSGAFTLADGRIATETFVLNGPDMRIAFNGGVDVPEPHVTRGVVALFFKGNVSRTIGKIPLVRDIVLGKDRAFVSLWFHLDGPWRDPQVRLIPTKTLSSGPTNLIFDGVPSFVRGGVEAIGRVADRWRDDGAAAETSDDGEGAVTSDAEGATQ